MGLEFIDTQTITGQEADFTEITFDPIIDFDDYTELYCVFSVGTLASRDLKFALGDSSQSGVINSGGLYEYAKTDQKNGTQTNELSSGENDFRVASHPRAESAEGCSGYIRCFITNTSSGDEKIAMQAFSNGTDVWWWCGGQIDQAVNRDIKYFKFFCGGSFQVGANITYYKLPKV